jgi:N-acetylneuraminic acid mutarotase
VCVGGSDERQHFAEAFQLELRNGVLVTTALPRLPHSLANACGAMVGSRLLIAGGIDEPGSTQASNSVLSIDLSEAQPRWKTEESLPGSGRILSIAAGNESSFWVFGGARLVAGKNGKPQRNYLRDAYQYDLGKGWKQIAELPRAAVAAPSPAPWFEDSIYVLGGDDGTQIDVPVAEHRGFSRMSFRYDPSGGKWFEAGGLPAPRVTTPCVKWGDSWIVPSGEERPTIRSPEVWSWTPAK